MLVSVILVALSLPVVAWAASPATLAILSRALPPRSYDPTPKLKFGGIVPGHNEELGISSTVSSLLGMDYPPHMRRIVVVADNCTDATAARAAEAGATVLERFDALQRGKGYALAYAFERTLADGAADAVVVVDADTTVTKNLLAAFDARLRSGAAAVQAEYGVANRQASWHTRLMHTGFTIFHDVRSRAREWL